MAYLMYDPDAEVLFLTIRQPEGGERDGERIDELRIRHYDHAGNVCAYEFLFVNRGISLEGIPEEDAALIREAVGRVKRLALTGAPVAAALSG